MKKTAFLGVGLSLALALVACTPSPNANNQEQPLLRIGIFTYPGFGPMYVAKEKGFFDQEGVRVEIVNFGVDISQGVSALASDNVQLLAGAADTPPLLADAGVDSKIVLASDIGYGADGLLVKNDVSSIKDLKGKTVNLSLGSPSHFFLRYVAEKSGLSKDDIELNMMEPDQVGAAFAAGQIDYGMSWEPWLSKASERKDGKVLFTSKDYLGAITDTFIARSDTVATRQEDVKKALRAWFKALDFIKSNPAEANEIMAKNFGLPVADLEAQLSTVKFLSHAENLDRFDQSKSMSFYELTSKAASIYKQDGVIKADINVDSVLDAQPLRTLYE